MSILLQAQLMRLLPFAGVPSYDREIARLRTALEPRGGIEGLAAEFDALDDEVEELELNGEVTDRSFGAVTNVYVDAVNGNDDNDGSVLGEPIKTAGRLFQLTGRVGVFYIDVKGELVIDERVTSHGYVENLFFIGRGEGASLRFVNSGAVVGGFDMRAGGKLRFLNIDLVDDTTSGIYAIYGPSGTYNIEMQNVDIRDGAARMASNKSLALMHLASLDLVTVGVTVSTQSGKVLQTIPAGTDPNANPLYRCNQSVL